MCCICNIELRRIMMSLWHCYSSGDILLLPQTITLSIGADMKTSQNAVYNFVAFLNRMLFHSNRPSIYPHVFISMFRLFGDGKLHSNYNHLTCPSQHSILGHTLWKEHSSFIFKKSHSLCDLRSLSSVGFDQLC